MIYVDHDMSGVWNTLVACCPHPPQAAVLSGLTILSLYRATADGSLHYGSGVHLIRQQAQLEGVQKLARQDDLHGRAQGEPLTLGREEKGVAAERCRYCCSLRRVQDLLLYTS